MKADLFVTCIVDQLFPEVGVSVVRVLRRLGVEVGFPEGQTCCGQAVFNSGFWRDARGMAERTLKEFADSDYVVVPSGSCGAMMRVFYLELFEDDPELLAMAQSLSSRVYEFSEFLVDVLGVGATEDSEGTDGGSDSHLDGGVGNDEGADGGSDSRLDGGVGNDGGSEAREEEMTQEATGTAVFHPGCHLLREMEVRDAPQSLLAAVPGLEMRELRNVETCCGFGGSFSVKMPHISEGMLSDKVSSVRESGADTLVSCDMSCLMHIGGALRRAAPEVKIRHIAQVLDGV